MNEREKLLDNWTTCEISQVVDTKSSPVARRSVFSRFCRCGANITIGLITDEGYIAAESDWNAHHSGVDHGEITRHEWLIEKLKQAA